MKIEIDIDEYGNLFKGFDTLVELGFDFKKNSARDFIEALLYLYMTNCDSIF